MAKFIKVRRFLLRILRANLRLIPVIGCLVSYSLYCSYIPHVKCIFALSHTRAGGRLSEISVSLARPTCLPQWRRQWVD